MSKEIEKLKNPKLKIECTITAYKDYCNTTLAGEERTMDIGQIELTPENVKEIVSTIKREMNVVRNRVVERFLAVQGDLLNGDPDETDETNA